MWCTGHSPAPATTGGAETATPHLAADAEYRRRFEREARLAASLDHSHIVRVYDAGHAQDVLYLAMRYVDGRNLATVLDNDGPMGLRQVCELPTGVAEALDSAHQAGLVHRDVKPANILIAPDQTTGHRHSWLCDFGIARHTTTTSALTTSRQVLGTCGIAPRSRFRADPPTVGPISTRWPA